MKIIDWFLLKSQDYKQHKKKTQNSFKKVKRDNILLVQKLRQHEIKIAQLQKALLETETIKFYKKKK